jgi:hypothetical protein
MAPHLPNQKNNKNNSTTSLRALGFTYLGLLEFRDGDYAWNRREQH